MGVSINAIRSWFEGETGGTGGFVLKSNRGLRHLREFSDGGTGSSICIPDAVNELSDIDPRSLRHVWLSQFAHLRAQ